MGQEEADLAIGTPVEVVSAENWYGRVCSTKSTLMFPDGIYCVEHAGEDGNPEHLWWHRRDLRVVSIQ